MGSNKKSLPKILKRQILFLAGLIFAGIGIVGIFLPLLPTTPFLILSAACFIRSSERYYHNLISNKWLGAYIRNYRDKTGVPMRTKIISISALWITIGYSVFYVASSLLVGMILVFIASAVSIHILTMKTLKDQVED